MQSTPPRRWFSFSLRTLFVVVTVVAICAAWVKSRLDWIEQRDEIMTSLSQIDPFLAPPDGEVTAPGLLWIIGEIGASDIYISSEVTKFAPGLKRLFPEAVIYSRPNYPDGPAARL